MAIGDIYKAEFVQNYGVGGEEMTNVFFYLGSAGDPTAVNLHAAMNDALGLRGAINGIQSTTVLNNRIKVTNLFSLTDFYEDLMTGAGVIGQLPLPMHDALNFSLKLDTRGIRPGSKRFSGITETFNESGTVSDAGAIAAINTLGIILADDINSTSPAATFEPIVVKRIPYVVDVGLPSEHDSWRLPANVGEADYGNVVFALVNLHISHQVSRGNAR